MPDTTQVVVDIGDVPILLRTDNRALVGLLEQRFGRFLNRAAVPAFQFDVTVAADDGFDPDADLLVRYGQGRWRVSRGDFHAEWTMQDRRGWIRQPASPYAIDSVLRIVHSLVLSNEHGFLLHAASIVRDGRGYLFTGPSGAGKSTIVSLAAPGTTVLTDEISYVKRVGSEFFAFGTPFVGELRDSGHRARAPIRALFTLEHASENRRTALPRPAAVMALMRNILFFADEQRLVDRVFDTACAFASVVPGYNLAFVPDDRIWQTIDG